MIDVVVDGGGNNAMAMIVVMEVINKNQMMMRGVFAFGGGSLDSDIVCLSVSKSHKDTILGNVRTWYAIFLR